jgi:hypothetical protein
MRTRVFISYRRKEDNGVAAEIADRLETDHFDVSLDERILTAGDDLKKRIKDEIDHADVFIPIVTNTYGKNCEAKPCYTRVEFQWAAQRHRHGDVIIIPIFHDITSDNGKQLLQDIVSAGDLLYVSTQDKEWMTTLLNSIKKQLDMAQRHKNGSRPWEQLWLPDGIIELPQSEDQFVQRPAITKWLNDAWNESQQSGLPRLVVLHGLRGFGKTLSLNWWLQKDGAPAIKRDGEAFVSWSFESCNPNECQPTADTFLGKLLDSLPATRMPDDTARDKARRAGEQLRNFRTLLVLDHIDTLLFPPQSPNAGTFRVDAIDELFRTLLERPSDCSNKGGLLCVLVSSMPIKKYAHASLAVGPMSPEESRQLFQRLHVDTSDAKMTEEVGGVLNHHPMSIALVSKFCAGSGSVSISDVRRQLRQSQSVLRHAVIEAVHAETDQQIFRYLQWLGEEPSEHSDIPLTVCRFAVLFRKEFSQKNIKALIDGLNSIGRGIKRPLSDDELRSLVDLRLVQLQLVSRVQITPGRTLITPPKYRLHALVREYFLSKWREEDPDGFQAAHGVLFEHFLEQLPVEPRSEDELQVCISAIWHGCGAGRHNEAFDQVLMGVLKTQKRRSMKVLGLAELGLDALSCFFSETWTEPDPRMSDGRKKILLTLAAEHLEAVGRFTEASDAWQQCSSLPSCELVQESRVYSLCSRAFVQIWLGEWAESLNTIRRALETTQPHSQHPSLIGQSQTCLLASAVHLLHYPGGDDIVRKRAVEEVSRLFEEIQRLNVQQGQTRLLTAELYWYSEFRFGDAERLAWRVLLGGCVPEDETVVRDNLRVALGEIEALQNEVRSGAVFQSPGREGRDIEGMHAMITAKTFILRKVLCSGTQISLSQDVIRLMIQNMSCFYEHYPSALLLAALCSHLKGDLVERDGLLEQAIGVCDRTGMLPRKADTLLASARLRRDERELSTAEGVMEEIRYERRRGELRDAKEALLQGLRSDAT